MKINKLNYSEDSYDILKNIDFEISSGDFIGIMGSSGSGKSTFLDIVSGIYSNYNGQILVNDSLIDFKKHSIASLISYMPQETMLFNLSIKENIVFGKDYDEVKFTTAVKTASVDEIISTVKKWGKTI